MALAKFNIEQGFEQVFGIYATIPAFVVNPPAKGAGLPEYEEAADKYLEGQYERGSNLVAPTGVPLWDRVSFDLPTKEGVRSYYMPEASVVTLGRAKNIVKTSLQGKNGTVKEYISMDDWDITISGFLIDYENDMYPEEQVRRMNDIFEINKSFKAGSKLFGLVGIERVVITGIKFPPMEGVQNAAAYELTLLSDEDIVLEVEDV